MLQSDLYIEYAIDARLKTVITLCESDFVTRDMLVGLPNYLQPQIDRKWAINKLRQAALTKAVQQWLRERW